MAQMALLDPITAGFVFAEVTGISPTYVTVKDTNVIVTHDVPVAVGASQAMATLTALALTSEGQFTVKVAGPTIARRPRWRRS